MRPGARAAVIIVSIVGCGALLMAGLATALFYSFRGINWSGLSESPAPVTMHDDTALAKRHYVSAALQCRIRFPAGPHSLQTGLNHDPHCEGDFLAAQSGRSITVTRTDRGGVSFDWFVRQNRDGLTHATKISDVVIRDQGRCAIQGVNGYVLTLTCVLSGQTVEQRLVMLDAPGHKVYMILGTSLIAQWAENADVLDSSLSTFELGSFTEDPPEIGENYQGPAPRLSLVPERLAPPTSEPALGIRDPHALGVTVEPSVPRAGLPHNSFASASEAVHYLQTGQEAEQQLALMYLARGPADAAARPQVLAAILPLLEDDKRCLFASKAVSIWATPDDAPQLRQELMRIRQHDPDGKSTASFFSLHALMDLLAKSSDPDSARVLADCLRVERLRAGASQALRTMGAAAAEDAVLDVVRDPDVTTARYAIQILGDIGTAKSLGPLQQVAGGSDRAQVIMARAALQHINTRLQNAR